jgi:hypothetical protein
VRHLAARQKGIGRFPAKARALLCGPALKSNCHATSAGAAQRAPEDAAAPTLKAKRRERMRLSNIKT